MFGSSMSLTLRAARSAYLNRLRRERRARLVRIDYMPSEDACKIIEAKRGRWYPMNIYSRILDAILIEWAELTGIKYGKIGDPKSSASDSGIVTPLRAHAYDFGAGFPSWAQRIIAKSNEKHANKRVTCGARRHRDGKTCQAKSEPGKRRCKWHGGCSTGPRTSSGKRRAMANLRQNRN